MESAELLNQARAAFIKDYAKTPEESGFSVIKCWNNEIVFAKNEQVFAALQKSQRLIKLGLNTFIVIILIWIIGIVLYLALSDTATANNFPFWIILSGMAVLFAICTGIQIKCNKWESIYLKEGCHLIYNGKKFYSIQDDAVINSHTVFF